VGEPGDRATVPLGRERLKAHFALFSTREIQNNAHVGWKNHCDFAGILIYRTLIAVHCASIAAIARVLQHLREHCGHCASIAAIAHCSHCASNAAIALALRPIAQ